jgi:uncharacterized protein YkwD
MTATQSFARRLRRGLVLAFCLAISVAMLQASGLHPASAAAGSPRLEGASAKNENAVDRAARTSQQFRAGVVRLTNQARDRRDRRALTRRPCLDAVAQRWARHMARTGKLVHNDFDNVRAACNREFGGGENIAMGYRTSRTVVSAWMHSTGHRANILRRSNDWIGVGAARDDDGTWWWVQNFADVG